MEWLVPHKLFVAQIQPFDELEEYAFRAIEKKEPVGDHKMVSIKREYKSHIKREEKDRKRMIYVSVFGVAASLDPVSFGVDSSITLE